MRLKCCEVHVCLITGGASSIYEKLNFFVDLCTVTQFALFTYLRLYEETTRAENCEKLLLKFNKYCLPELQWCSFAFALSFNILPRLGTRGESRAERLTKAAIDPLRALVASKFHIAPQQRTFTLWCVRNLNLRLGQLNFLARWGLGGMQRDKAPVEGPQSEGVGGGTRRRDW